MAKKIVIYLFISIEMCNFAADFNNTMTMKSVNLISNLIIIRLRGVVGSDEACK